MIDPEMPVPYNEDYVVSIITDRAEAAAEVMNVG